MFQLSIVPVMSNVAVIYFSSTAVLTANGNFAIVSLLHSASDIIPQSVAVLLTTTAEFTFLSFHTTFH